MSELFKKTEESTGVRSSPENLAEMFRLVVSKTYTEVQVFPGPILVSVKDVEELHAQIGQKLSRQRENVIGSDFNALVSFENNRTTEHSSWPAFVQAHWQIAEITKSLVLSWNFLVKVDNESKPEHHTITVRLSNAMHPVQYLQAAFSKNPDDLEKIEFDDAPMLCRVAVPDSLLSKELLAIAAEWNKARRKPVISIPWVKQLKKRSGFVGTAVGLSFFLFSIAAYFAWYLNTCFIGLSSEVLTLQHLRLTIYLFLGFIIVVNVVTKISQWLGAVAERHLDKFGRFTVFEFTNGDSNKQTELMAKNNKSIYKFSAASLFSIFWNLVAGFMIYFWTLPPHAK